MPGVAPGPSQQEEQQQDAAAGSGSGLLYTAQQPAQATWDATPQACEGQPDIQPAMLNAGPPEQSAADERGHAWGRGFTADPHVIIMRIHLVGSDPEVWRRFWVPSTVSLSALHGVIQDVMGWEDSHLHQFVIGSQRFADPSYNVEGAADAGGVALSDVLQQPGDVLDYEYDFGDGWEHRLTAVDFDPGTLQHAECTGGEGRCPLENIGGIGGYSEFLQTITDPTHPEYEEMVAWYDGPLDPDEFDVDQINARLAHRRLC